MEVRTDGGEAEEGKESMWEMREGERKHTEEMGGKETGLLQAARLEIASKSLVSVTLNPDMPAGQD